MATYFPYTTLLRSVIVANDLIWCSEEHAAFTEVKIGLSVPKGTSQIGPERDFIEIQYVMVLGWQPHNRPIHTIDQRDQWMLRRSDEHTSELQSTMRI